VYIIPRNKYNCFKFKLKKKEKDHWLEFENWTLKIYIRRAIGSLSHLGPVISERKKSGSDLGQFHYAMITDAQ
jgi:hypothetical protein